MVRAQRRGLSLTPAWPDTHASDDTPGGRHTMSTREGQGA